jgi:hypothetical protein
MGKFLKNIDMFGQYLQLYIKDKGKIKSDLGGVITIIMIIVISIFSWFLGNDIIYKENPFSFEQIYINSFYNIQTINRKTFPFSIAIMDFNGYPLYDPSYLQLRLNMVNITYDPLTSKQKTNYKHIDLKPCTLDDFDGLSFDSFESLSLNKTYCPIGMNETLHGYWGQSEIVHLKIDTVVCDNSINSNCKPIQEIEKYIANNSLNMNIFFYDTAVSLKNYSQPINKFIYNKYFYYDIQKYKICEYRINTNEITTDDNFFMSDVDRLNYIKLEEILCDYTNFNTAKKELGSILIYTSNINKQHYRKYIKVPDICAKVGGVMQVFYVSFNFIIAKFVEIKKFWKIIEEIFYYDNNDINDNLNLFINKKGKLSVNKNNTTSESCISVKNNNYIVPKDDTTKKLMREVIKRHIRLDVRFNCLDKMRITLRRCLKTRYSKEFREKLMFYETAKEKTKKYFDLISFIEKFEEFERMKHLLLKQDQIYLLMFHRKLRFTLEEEIKPRGAILNKHRIENILDEFAKKFNDGNNDKVDDKILELFNL